jgi:hypothetical protein
MMTIWLPDLAARSGPRYLALVEALAEDVASGALPAGQRLPPQRDLAFRLGVTVGTVGRAYALAAQRGLVAGEVGRGTYVRARQAGATCYHTFIRLVICPRGEFLVGGKKKAPNLMWRAMGEGGINIIRSNWDRLGHIRCTNLMYS